MFGFFNGVWEIGDVLVLLDDWFYYVVSGEMCVEVGIVDMNFGVVVFFGVDDWGE